MISEKLRCFLQILILIKYTFTVIIYTLGATNRNFLIDTDFQITTNFYFNSVTIQSRPNYLATIKLFRTVSDQQGYILQFR